MRSRKYFLKANTPGKMCLSPLRYGIVMQLYKSNREIDCAIIFNDQLPMIANHPDRVERFLKKSLDNLKTSYVDMYLIHFPVGFQYEADDNYFPKNKEGAIQLDFSYSDLLSLWSAMEDLVFAGRALAIGVSNFSLRQITKILNNARIPPANLQVS